jgi:aspartate/methionine/tyrosine aminotransferase
MAMSKRADELGDHVLHLEVGQPSTPAPVLVREAAAAALAAQPIGYTNAPGLPALRRRIAEHYVDWYDVEIDDDDVLVVAGASAGFTLAFLACFDPGDRVGVLEPGYPCYRNALQALGCDVVPIPVGPDTRWAPTREVLDEVGELAGLVVASPSNPTGTVLGSSALAEIVTWCRERGVRLISDEIYHGLVIGEPAQSVLQHDKGTERDVVVVNSFSKYFSMTGWRLGWIVAPPFLRPTIERLQQNFYICAATLSQYAAVAAFAAHDELAAHVQRYAANRTVLLDGLATVGLTNIAAADGAFYVYADVSTFGMPSSQLCHAWLDEAGVATTPGIDFDLGRGERFVRFSYAGRADHLAEACERLVAWVGRR